MANRIQRMQIHVLPFTDHQGHAAGLVFRGRASCPLPPLYALAIYFTHPDASSDNVDPAALFTAINQPSGTHEIRLELYFLPHATVSDCIAHYHSEKAQRGDYKAQITAVQNNAPPFPTLATDETKTSGTRLPGLVPSYIDDFKTYHGVLYLCTERDWRLNERVMCQVLFDPCSDGEWAAWREESDPEVQPATQLQSSPLGQDSPVLIH
ncbi:uncharacterized protein DSM5745_03714 [Aspergillus mulundensis]|uniref:Uncharacterized protein n=1 Tax=Aspergillus mulundensis TaxID=1810919 RepID=A0A3D8SLD4_9EURO|nr:hypothetical protein DSM5745_03714 [Aspergillus mulundensis]RDW87072.1 hypothetical protein DSM5745_03714 [Aspergillus mulundensis]